LCPYSKEKKNIDALGKKADFLVVGEIYPDEQPSFLEITRHHPGRNEADSKT